MAVLVPPIATLGIDVEDWFHVENLRSACPRACWPDIEPRVFRNVEQILEVLRRHNRHVTFFFLGLVAEKAPASFVRDIAGEGHEIACHGYGHEILHNLTDVEIREDIRRAKAFLEDLAQQSILGYRAPAFSVRPSVIEILQELGFQYDSSLNPTVVSRRYGRMEWSRFREEGLIYRIGDLYEVPMSTLGILGRSLPVAGGGYLRLYPYPLFRLFARHVLRVKGLFNAYIHPWEIDGEAPRLKGIRWDFKFRHYLNLSKGLERFDQLVSDFAFRPLRELIPETSLQKEEC